MEYKHKLPTLEEVKEGRPILRNSVHDSRLSLSPLDSLAVGITHRIGSMGFFIILLIWTVGWLLWNLLAPVELRFDKAPGFLIWIFVSNLIQLVILPLVMVSQNIEGKIAEHRAEADFEVNQKSEKEIEVIIAHLENQDQTLQEILRKIN